MSLNTLKNQSFKGVELRRLKNPGTHNGPFVEMDNRVITRKSYKSQEFVN